MENVKSFLTRIRKPDKSTPRHIQILVSIGIAMAGFALGVLQKWLDSGAVNELPIILQRIDIGNYFGKIIEQHEICRRGVYGCILDDEKTLRCHSLHRDLIFCKIVI